MTNTKARGKIKISENDTITYEISKNNIIYIRRNGKLSSLGHIIEIDNLLKRK